MIEKFKLSTAEAVPKSQEEGEKLKAEVLDMSPRELVDYFKFLEKEGKLLKFLEDNLEDDAVMAHFSYWEKWLKKDHRRLVDEAVEKKKQLYPGNSESLPLNLDKKFSQQELDLIFKNLGAIQLTFGCSKGCPFCGFDAIKGVREAIPYSQLANLFKNHGDKLKRNEPLLYWASEPSDYASKEGLEDKTYADVHQLAVEYAGYNPHITSKETTDEKWVDFLQTGPINNPRVSVYGLDAKALVVVEKNFSISGKSVRNAMTAVGEGEKHKKGMGISAEKNDMPNEFGIGCFNGTLLTPRGLYNVIQVPISKKYPQGQMMVPIEKIETGEIKIGDYLPDILKAGAIVKHKRDRSIMDNLEYFTLKSGGSTYDVAIDENFIITDMLCWDEKEENADKMGLAVGARGVSGSEEHIKRRRDLQNANGISNGYFPRLSNFLSVFKSLSPIGGQAEVTFGDFHLQPVDMEKAEELLMAPMDIYRAIITHKQLPVNPKLTLKFEGNVVTVFYEV